VTGAGSGIGAATAKALSAAGARVVVSDLDHRAPFLQLLGASRQLEGPHLPSRQMQLTRAPSSSSSRLLPQIAKSSYWACYITYVLA
jgi:NAD(P)-dependent dehydrogenase (short-subunit alcohol dehydrogenase family)